MKTNSRIKFNNSFFFSAILLPIFLFIFSSTLSARTAADIRKEQDARTFGSRLRNNEHLSKEEEKYVETMLKKKRISRLELADHLDRSYLKSERLEHQQQNQSTSGKRSMLRHRKNHEVYSFLFVFVVAVIFTTIIVLIRFLIVGIKHRIREKKQVENYFTDNDF